jgi:hypothetical protein
MREKLNSNPIAQVALVCVLLVVVGFLLISQMGGGGSSTTTPTTATTPATPTTPTTGTTTPTTPTPTTGTTTPSTTPGAVPSVAVSGISVPRLPGVVTRAYKSGKTVVLLVVHNGGIDDRRVLETVPDINAVGDVATFVVPAHEVSRYAAITLGLEVDRTPALIVMRPKRLSKGTPQATVTYGFQSPQAVVQEVRDASYDGPYLTYHPN